MLLKGGTHNNYEIAYIKYIKYKIKKQELITWQGCNKKNLLIIALDIVIMIMNGTYT